MKSIEDILIKRLDSFLAEIMILLFCWMAVAFVLTVLSKYLPESRVKKAFPEIFSRSSLITILSFSLAFITPLVVGFEKIPSVESLEILSKGVVFWALMISFCGIVGVVEGFSDGLSKRALMELRLVEGDEDNPLLLMFFRASWTSVSFLIAALMSVRFQAIWLGVAVYAGLFYLGRWVALLRFYSKMAIEI